MKKLIFCAFIMVLFVGTGCEEVSQGIVDEQVEIALSYNTTPIVEKVYLSGNSLVPYGINKESKNISADRKAELLRKQTVALGEALRELRNLTSWNAADEYVQNFLKENDDANFNNYLTIHLSHVMTLRSINNTDNTSDKNLDSELKYINQLLSNGYPDVNVILASIQARSSQLDNTQKNQIINKAIMNAEQFVQATCGTCIEKLISVDSNSKLNPEEVLINESPNMVVSNIANTLAYLQ